jgi:ATP-dependent Clp protease adaptor protein ClpS
MGNSEEKHKLDEFFGLKKSNKKALVLYNDDSNYFDFVINTLIKVCDHSEIQAEQCALIVHYKGKCDVKQGIYKQLKPLREALVDHGLNAAIE